MTKSDCSLSAEYSLRLPFLDFCALFCLFPTPSFSYYLLGVCALSSNLDWGWEMGMEKVSTPTLPGDDSIMPV